MIYVELLGLCTSVGSIMWSKVIAVFIIAVCVSVKFFFSDVAGLWC